MRFVPSILLGVVATLAATSAFAETPDATPSIEPGDFAQFAELRLGDEFEKSVARVGDGSLTGLGGPSSMSCSHALTGDALDTCVVTAQGAPSPAAPAALAQN